MQKSNVLLKIYKSNKKEIELVKRILYSIKILEEATGSGSMGIKN